MFPQENARHSTDQSAHSVILYGESFARLTAKQYTYIFIGCDLVSLSLQGTTTRSMLHDRHTRTRPNLIFLPSGAGGGLASVAAQDNSDPTTGDNVMMSGLVFQVFSLVLFAAATIDYYLRARKEYRGKDGPRAAHPRIKWFFAALTLSYTCIMIRCIYRVIELSDGWTSELMKREKDFVVLEGV